jgi:hypothetical protein
VQRQILAVRSRCLGAQHKDVGLGHQEGQRLRELAGRS